MIICKSGTELSFMRKAERVDTETNHSLVEHIEPGMTTGELDHLADRYIRSQGAVPSFKGYNGFPASICASVNEQLVHGFPGKRKLNKGDIIAKTRQFTMSHAIRQYIENPNRGIPERGPRLKTGMVLAIELMVHIGSRHVGALEDNWTVVTVNVASRARNEQAVTVTTDGMDIFTKLSA
ncbi:M24 family metallopeptidase [Paenibacillus maysiensis]|uniref:M24 family metallopeptidase n=1 Tax=Paenibacillus maysiensis TaxID=1155954 RepID=UPI000470A4F5|nr:M24 family metallopeptidase [Paenibacillus maysiensis]